jgi:hypothetical protein
MSFTSFLFLSVFSSVVFTLASITLIRIIL